MLIVYAIMIKSQIQQILKKDKKNHNKNFPCGYHWLRWVEGTMEELFHRTQDDW